MNGAGYVVVAASGVALGWAVWWLVCTVAVMIADRPPIIRDPAGRARASRMQPVTVAVCGHQWAFLPTVGDPRTNWHVCGRRAGHRLPHKCRDCNAETSDR